MYATVEQANVYVLEYYSSSSTVSILWNQLSDDDKQVLLNRAAQTIDMLPLTGRAVLPDRAFPRDPDVAISLERAMQATIELAVQRNSNIETQERMNLQKQGVKSYRIGDLSETYRDDYMKTGEDTFALETVYPYLRSWLSGGYRICHSRTRK